MRRYAYAVVLFALLAFVIAYAIASGMNVLDVLRTADVGWKASPSWNIPLMLWGIVLNGAGVLLELMPYFILGVLLGGFLSEFVSRAAIEKHMGQGGTKSITIATCAGGAVPICYCGILPVLAGLVQARLPLARFATGVRLGQNLCLVLHCESPPHRLFQHLRRGGR